MGFKSGGGTKLRFNKCSYVASFTEALEGAALPDRPKGFDRDRPE
jgi:hypothetical protein